MREVIGRAELPDGVILTVTLAGRIYRIGVEIDDFFCFHNPYGPAIFKTKSPLTSVMAWLKAAVKSKKSVWAADDMFDYQFFLFNSRVIWLTEEVSPTQELLMELLSSVRLRRAQHASVLFAAQRMLSLSDATVLAIRAAIELRS